MNDGKIIFQNVSFSYDPGSADTPLALEDVSFTVEKGEFLAVLGRNGSGKSTFAKLINGILMPTCGKVLVDGTDTASEEDLPAIRRKVGMVFQNPENQLVSNIVEEDVAFGPENLGIEPGLIRQRVNAALEAVDMTEFARHSPHKLSGGQKQRVAIAGILAMKPDYIIFDESTAMLDPRGRNEIMETILRLNRRDKITVVLITHHMDEAVRADRIAVMDRGRICKTGTPREIFSDVSFLQQAGLDAPQVTELIDLLSQERALSSISFPKGILTEEEAASALVEIWNKEQYGRN